MQGSTRIHIRAKDVIKYVALPGIVPRVKEFTGSGFSWLAQLMAIIYQTVRLLPSDHPYLRPENAGKFGIRHVITEAANNLKFTWGNIDQIIVFFALLIGFIVLILQFVVLVMMVVIKPTFAVPFVLSAGLSNIFTTPGCTGLGAACPDIAFQILDQVFGVPGDLFNSNYAPIAPAPLGGGGAVPPLNAGLHLLFEFYSMAILIVAVLIFLYYVVIIIAETAQTGTPFGRRFNYFWAPLRVIVALGLLIPITVGPNAVGLNGAQYITLLTAKWGSGMATNGWILFNTTLAKNPTDMGGESMIARPNSPDAQHIVAFMTLVRTCKAAYEKMYQDAAGNPITPIRAYFVEDGTLNASEIVNGFDTEYERGLEDYYHNKDMIIRFGHEDPVLHDKHAGGVYPYCGEITITTSVTNIGGAMPPTGSDTWGPWQMQYLYFSLVMNAWGNGDYATFADRMVRITLPVLPRNPCAAAPLTGEWGIGCDPKNPMPTALFKRKIIEDSVSAINALIGFVYFTWSADLDAAGAYIVPPDVLARGWGGAAMWYNKIALWNGSIVTSVANMPTPSLLPDVMEEVQEARRTNDEMIDAVLRFEPYLSDGREVNFSNEGEIDIAKTLSEVYLFWMEADSTVPLDDQSQGNVFFDALGAILGLEGLFTIRTNKDTHPLAQLSSIGKSIIESAIRNLMTSLAFSAAGGMTEIMHPHIGAFLGAASSILVSLTTIGITIGFILYYVLPFLPFIYFFFAVSSWVKTIFEAMVGVPLWALAHLRIDGDGLPGESAMNGYFLIFEIFVRPILTVFGLIAGMVIFTAMARVLNDLFPLVVENLTGFDPIPDGMVLMDINAVGAIPNAVHKHNIIDEFFFTIVYTILIYMIATSSFKLIDQIPGNILRWIGASVQSFSDQAGDPAQGMVQYAAINASQISGQVVDVAHQGSGVAGRGAGSLFSRNSGGGSQVTGK